MTFHLQVMLAVTDDGGMPVGLDEPSWTVDASDGGPPLYRIVSLHRAGDAAEVEADTPEEALEVLFEAANVGGRLPRWEEGYRRRDRARSLSVGDVVVVNGEVVFQVLSFGWGRLPAVMAGQVAGMVDGRWWGEVARERAAVSGRRVIIT